MKLYVRRYQIREKLRFAFTANAKRFNRCVMTNVGLMLLLSKQIIPFHGFKRLIKTKKLHEQYKYTLEINFLQTVMKQQPKYKRLDRSKLAILSNSRNTPVSRYLVPLYYLTKGAFAQAKPRFVVKIFINPKQSANKTLSLNNRKHI